MEDTNRTTLEKCASGFKTDIIKYPLMAATSALALRALIGAYRRIADENEYDEIEKEMKRRNKAIVANDPLSFVEKEASAKQAGWDFLKNIGNKLKFWGKNLVEKNPGKIALGTIGAADAIQSELTGNEMYAGKLLGYGTNKAINIIKNTAKETETAKEWTPDLESAMKTLGIIGAAGLAGYGGWKLMDYLINKTRKKQLEKELEDTEKEYAKRILLLGDMNKNQDKLKTASFGMESMNTGTKLLALVLGAISLPVIATAYKSYKVKQMMDPALNRKDDLLGVQTPDIIVTEEEKKDADNKVQKLKLVEDVNNPKNQLQAMAEDPGVFNQTEPVESSRELQLTDYSGLDASEMKDIQDPETQKKVACELALENILSGENANAFGIQDLVRVVANGDVEAIEKSASTYKNEEAIHETVAVLAPFATNFDDISTARVKLACMWISNNENVRPLVENTIHTQNILSMPQIVKVASEMPKEMEPYMDFLAYKDMLDSRDFAFSLCDEGFEKSASAEDVFDARDIPFDDEAVLFDLLAGKHIKTASKDMDIESRIVDQIAKSIY